MLQLAPLGRVLVWQLAWHTVASIMTRPGGFVVTIEQCALEQDWMVDGGVVSGKGACVESNLCDFSWSLLLQPWEKECALRVVGPYGIILCFLFML